MITDVHAHLDFFPPEKLNEIQENKRIKLVITNSVNLKSCEKNLEISKKFSKVKFAAGLYPESDVTIEKFKDFENFVLKNKKNIFAIGEIGIDKTEGLDFEFQKKIFIKQVELAKKLGFPVIVHSRKAEAEAIEILEKFPDVKVVMHCFSGNFKLIKRGISAGFYFSIPASIVRSEHFQKMAREIPREKILTETDSPYLSPFLEKKNEPAFISESIKKISEIWGVSPSEVGEQIEKNFKVLFQNLM